MAEHRLSGYPHLAFAENAIADNDFRDSDNISRHHYVVLYQRVLNGLLVIFPSLVKFCEFFLLQLLFCDTFFNSLCERWELMERSFLHKLGRAIHVY